MNKLLHLKDKSPDKTRKLNRRNVLWKTCCLITALIGISSITYADDFKATARVTYIAKYDCLSVTCDNASGLEKNGNGKQYGNIGIAQSGYAYVQYQKDGKAHYSDGREGIRYKMDGKTSFYVAPYRTNGGELILYASGYINFENGAQTYSTKETGKITPPNITDVKYTMSDGKAKVEITWSKSGGGNADNFGNIDLYDNNEKLESLSFSAEGKTNGKLTFEIKSINDYISKKHVFYLRQTYSSWLPNSDGGFGANYEVNGASKELDPISHPTLEAPQFNNLTGEVTLKWNIPTTDNDASKFEIQRATDNMFINESTTIEADFNQTTSTYTFVDNITEKGYSNKTLYYRIRRKSEEVFQWTNTLPVEIKINALLRDFTAGTTTINETKTSATITWSYTSGVWPEGSVLKLCRNNSTTGEYSEIETISTADANKGYVEIDNKYVFTYIDKYIAPCNRYSYFLKFISGNAAYPSPDPINIPGEILFTEVGTISNLEASKGYYPDRVSLKWNVEGVFDRFRLRRVEYSPDNTVKDTVLVRTIDSSTSNIVMTEDNTSAPGVYYVYIVDGIVACDKKEFHSNQLSTVGFRSPTGNIYGRVTFENGQAVDNVDVYLEGEEPLGGKSILFSGDDGSYLKADKEVPIAADSLCLQAWIKASDDIPQGIIVANGQQYGLGFDAGHFVFRANGKTYHSVTPYEQPQNKGFIHISASMHKGVPSLILNGNTLIELETREKDGNIFDDNSGTVIGKGFKGNIDEMRIWNIPLDTIANTRNYGRLLYGGEKGLLAYWRFNDGIKNEFYDLSYEKNTYHANHGRMVGDPVYSNDIPTEAQLKLRGITDDSGNYTISGVPYQGQGTMYNIIPQKDIHQFNPLRIPAMISDGTKSFTANFIDNSSFSVNGYVKYAGGTIPVEGVSFKIDGVTAMDSKGNVLETGADGQYTIQVPVGTHEVKAVKNNHVFELDGRLTNSDHKDRDYQTNVVMSGDDPIWDLTTVRYIGRVCGGTTEERYPIGHSLSKNNLGEGIQVKLAFAGNNAYTWSTTEQNIEMEHFKPGNKTEDEVKTNNATLKGNEMTIYPNAETGEFVIDVIPVKYNLSIELPDYMEAYQGLGLKPEEVNLSNVFIQQTSLHEYTDSTAVATDKDGNVTQWSYQDYSDTVYYNQKRIYAVRVTPTIQLTQLKSSKKLPYYGEEECSYLDSEGNISTFKAFDEENGYVLDGKPVFQQNTLYTYEAQLSEKYPYYTADREITETDEVPTYDAKVTLTNNLSSTASSLEENTDSLGIARFSFKFDKEVDLTTIQASIELSADYGGLNKATDKIGGWQLGANSRGTDFITAGPDKVLMVLRDPPGSKSYSYIEEGTTVKESTSTSVAIAQVGNEDLKQQLGAKLVTFTGVGVGTINSAESSTGFSVGFKHEVETTSESTAEVATTINTRFATSDDPLYVGANGDVYIGNSTNISFGTTDAIKIIDRETYDNVGGNTAFAKEYFVNDQYAIVQQPVIGAKQIYNTMFFYTQVFLEQRLIPNMEEVRNSILWQPELYPNPQAEADRTKQPVYISKLKADDDNFGKSNSDPVFGDPEGAQKFDGKSYKVYFPKIENKVWNDTIQYMNSSIEAWKQRIGDNEKAKVEAELIKNYSFQAGASVEFAYECTETKSQKQNFKTLIGATFGNSEDLDIMGNGFEIEINEEATTEINASNESGTETSQKQGFTLADEGDDDYISVDVCKEKTPIKGTTSTFIFKTKAGATSCPYEGATYTQYYKPGTKISEATIQIEKPSIDAENKYIENVPSGQPARITLYLKNNSEMLEDGWYNLKIVDGANPYGAKLSIDGAPIGNGRAILVPAGEVLVKTLEVSKGSVLKYEDLAITLESQCQCDPTDFAENIVDTVKFTVIFTPSCTDVKIKQPANNWTYNTNLPTEEVNGLTKHYMNVVIGDFDVNYDNFKSIKLQYKPASGSDNDWSTLMTYFNDETLYNKEIENGGNAAMIDPKAYGTITYKWFMDDMQDQRYDLRAVSYCKIDDATDVENISEVASGIKDMYRPRLFGSVQPADGILTINDEARLNFNETIAEGYLTENNFSVTGVRNGAQTSHSVSARLDGINDFFSSEFERNWGNKDITIEMWISADKAQDATLFSQGNRNESLELGITADNHLKVKVGETTLVSKEAFNFDQGSWAHVAMTLDKDGTVSAFYNFTEYIDHVQTKAYSGEGNYIFGRSIATESDCFAGKMDNARIWDKVLTAGRIQTNSNVKLSGAENNLMAYYPMDEAKGNVLADKARGVNLKMNGGEWSLPDGRAATFNGINQYVKAEISQSVTIDTSMDYTIEFWFKADANQTHATLIGNGRGDNEEYDGSKYLFNIGFEEGVLTFRNNGLEITTEGNYLDNEWHHYALCVNRTTGRSQILIDGALKTYFDSQDLGGLASANLYIGARSWSPENDYATVNVDNFFKGLIDELRFWNLYRTESIISESNNERLDGKEKGLLAYYPFDDYITWQGTQELQFTLKDMKVQQDPAIIIPEAEAVGGDLQSADIAPVKDKGPVNNLLYDFVVNNDALIINLNEPWESVEKTIVTFTVEGVRDINGNTTASPITWSAYIDRNQLKWDESEINKNKKEYEPLKFTVKANNLGGSIQHFTIENAPSWLNVSPVEGTIAPSSGQDITFTVDEGLNIGSYNEVIYMRNDNNVSEALPLNIKVNGEKPNWSVNPNDFKYSMSVYGKMRINNLFSADEEDMLAAFSNGKCVGVANNQYLKINDMWYTFLTVYNNENKTDNLEFRMWDASTGKMYMATPSEAISFESDVVKGSASNPVIFDGKELMVQNVPMKEGWNWISFNVATESLKSIRETLKHNTWTNDDLVKDETNEVFASYLAKNNTWVGTMSETGFGNQYMYLVKSSEAQTISVTGSPIKSKDDLTLNLKKGWNYISYLPTGNLNLKEALAGFEAAEGDIVKGQNAFAMYNGNLGWLGNLTYMEPGKGYMLQSSKAATLTYPVVSSSIMRSKTATRTAGTDGSVYSNNRFASNMSVVATVKGNLSTENGDRILAYAGGELRGVAESIENPENDSIVYFITIAGETKEPVSFALERNGKIIGQTGAEFDYDANDVKGDLNEPYTLNFMKESEANVYPNPFVDELHVSMSVNPEATVVISLVDVSGRIVKELDVPQNGGYINVTMKHLGSLAEGVYMVNVKVDEENHVYKVVKK